MLDENYIALSKVRLEKAKDCLDAAFALLENNHISSIPNRSYYAIFHAMRAVLVFDGIDRKHHSGLIAEFRKLYVKTGVFDEELSNTISVLSDSRTGGDYDDFYIISKADATENLKKAESFVYCIEKYLINNKYGE